MPDPISPTGSPGQQMTMAVGFPTAAPAPRPVLDPPQGPETPSTELPPALRDALSLETAKPVGAAKAAPDKDTLEGAAQSLRTFLKNLPTNLEVRQDQETGIVVYKVVNPVTKEVVRQYPPDEMVEMARRLKRLASKEEPGILLDRNL